MRFRCKMVDVSAMRDFTNVVNGLSRIAKNCVLRITPEKLTFKVGDDRIPTMLADISPKHFFTEYVMHGVSEEQNEIYIQIETNALARCLVSLRMTARSMKMKLSHKREPCLTLEINLPSLALEARHCVHDIPVRVIPRKEWPDHQMPDLPNFDISVNMPQLKYVRNVVERMKNMSTRLTLCADNVGEFVLKIDTDSATVSTHFQDLQVLTTSRNESNDKISATIDIKKFWLFLGWDVLHSNNMKCNIIEGKMVNLSLEMEDHLKIQNFIPAIAS